MTEENISGNVFGEEGPDVFNYPEAKMKNKFLEVLRKASRFLHNYVYIFASSEVVQTRKYMEALNNANSKLIEMKEQIDKQTTSEIDLYLMHQFPDKEIPNIAYKGKRNSDLQSHYLNEFITPDSYEVQKFVKNFDKSSFLNYIKKVGDKLAKNTTWVDEKELYPNKDYYLYPSETLTSFHDNCDCEDVSFVMASFEPTKTAVNWGKLKVNGKWFGHAWPEVLYEGNLYVVETTGNSVKLIPKEKAEDYETYIVCTKNKTFRIKKGLEFGFSP